MVTKTIIGLIAQVLVLTTTAFAYDATCNFGQPQPELVAGWKFECGPTKGGPYPNITDCGKPAAKPDGTFDCIGKDFYANPLYCVVSNYDTNKAKMATSPEGSLTITVQPPTVPKLAVVIKTVAKIIKGKPYATTTVKYVAYTESFKEGTHSYRNAAGEQITTTKLVM